MFFLRSFTEIWRQRKISMLVAIPIVDVDVDDAHRELRIQNISGWMVLLCTLAECVTNCSRLLHVKVNWIEIHTENPMRKIDSDRKSKKFTWSYCILASQFGICSFPTINISVEIIYVLFTRCAHWFCLQS